MRGADPQRNSERRIFWTPVYLDEQAKAWMVSVIQPLDWQGRWVGTVGHDLTIETLIDAVAASRYQVGVQLILSAEGDLISHPDLRERIAAASGQLQIAGLKDPLLEQVHHMVSNAQADRGAGLSADGTQWIAWSRIRGPHWYQIYLMPQSRVDGLVMWGMLGLCGIGLLGLMPVLWSMRRRVNTLVVRPLQRLTEAVDTLGQGQTPTPVALGTDDELGRLARAFDGMVSELAQQRAMAEQHDAAVRPQLEMAEPQLLVDQRERLVRNDALVFDDANVGKGEQLDHAIVGAPDGAQFIGCPASLRGRDDLVLADQARVAADPVDSGVDGTVDQIGLGVLDGVQVIARSQAHISLVQGVARHIAGPAQPVGHLGLELVVTLDDELAQAAQPRILHGRQASLRSV